MKKEKKAQFKIKINLQKAMYGFIILLIIAPFLLGFFQTQIDDSRIDLSQGLGDIRKDEVRQVKVEDEKLTFIYNSGEEKISTKESGLTFPELLEKSGIDPLSVEFVVVDTTVIKVVGEILGILLPVVLMGAFFLFLVRSQSRGAREIFSFGRSRAKLFAKGKQNITFADVAGVDEAKKELEEVVDFLKSPAKYKRIGARTPKGALLVGPAGVGKTLLARAVAGEAGVPFFSIAGSEFMEMLVGVGASRVRDLFGQAKASAPAIIFIDEIDAIGRQRGRGIIGGHDEREQTLNQILVEMDGFTPNDNVVVVAATNRGDLLDPALLRPGRFDRRVVLDMPDKDGRSAILKIHAQGKRFVGGINWGVVADRTVGFSGADLENMLNEAAIYAARSGKTDVNMSDVEEAATKVKLGPAKKKLQSEEDRRITAYHEGGHAIATHFLPKTDPVHRISIVARGMSLGHTLIPPSADRTHETKTHLLEQIIAMLGGRAAEEVVFNEMTAGAGNDIRQATTLARAMVVDLGMSGLGPINWSNQDEAYLDNGAPKWIEGGNISQALQEKVDLEIKKIIDSCYVESKKIVKSRRKLLDNVVEVLLKKETMDREDFEKIVGKKVNGK
ncbi:MAG: ATP-dependent zinc metalloprotease FtsH [Candidatus Woesebacteria bacterium GW2011_GWB1_43_14]|uniref:ATP-dependent zinc metalloprotease FtsH n=1 Tax=Candidatus Woesebacteria bacterium GW2011_GWB1_43_14 TaxID=1618578 RepID=A0A0G1GJC1_9BACT|nr:MAG: ATP-dependent zinc metalloprotease FtsH [Candidatus Woesebacteria bacterium GW2011_GWC1_42_9]KKS98868.1 MAG: ATP-dependent zinc metalloprotease FtsH [Candidatus Woesebacteria bacterium GW2011_GWB1_43_14]